MNAKQLAICERYGAHFLPTSDYDKIGIAENVRTGMMPINGLRHPPENGTTGWFIWAGEVIEDRDDFFSPLHAAHIDEWSTLVRPFLGLAPGWRFMVTTTYVDVWFDQSLLEVLSRQ